MPALYPVLYVRLPGLLCKAARQSHVVPESASLAVTSERVVRDACPLTFAPGVRIGAPLSRARRLCPALFIVPLEEIDARALSPLSARLLGVLAAHTPTIEPDGPNAAYADFTGGPPPDVAALIHEWNALATGFAPLLGLGVSRIAARACAECALPPNAFSDADSRWLWPEDEKVIARLYRLGLNTFGDVAAVGESALVYQFGKVGRLLYQRSVGRDFTPVRPLWPLPRITVHRRFEEEPITDEGYLRAAFTNLASHLSGELRREGRHCRRLTLMIQTERGQQSAEWVLPFPVQAQAEIRAALRRLRAQVAVSSAIVSLEAVASEIDLPPAATGNLFEERAAERKIALASTRQKLRSRYGIKALRTLGEIVLPRREIRRTLRRERLSA